MLYPTDYLRVFIWGIKGIYDFIALNIGIGLWAKNTCILPQESIHSSEQSLCNK